MSQRVITEEYTLGKKCCLNLLDLRLNSLDTVTSSLNIKIIPYCMHNEKGINKNNSYSKAKQITNSSYKERIRTGQKKKSCCCCGGGGGGSNGTLRELYL